MAASEHSYAADHEAAVQYLTRASSHTGDAPAIAVEAHSLVRPSISLAMFAV